MSLTSYRAAPPRVNKRIRNNGTFLKDDDGIALIFTKRKPFPTLFKRLFITLFDRQEYV